MNVNKLIGKMDIISPKEIRAAIVSVPLPMKEPNNKLTPINATAKIYFIFNNHLNSFLDGAINTIFLGIVIEKKYSTAIKINIKINFELIFSYDISP